MVNGSGCDLALSRTQRAIEQWRLRHRPRARLPEHLWREAAQLAREQGINRTARALRLDYYSLKRHATEATASRQPAPEFLEILPSVMPAPRPPCTVELEDASGVKLRIGLPGGAVPDLAALVRLFRECRS